MALCDKCFYWDKEYSDFREEYDDVIEVDAPNVQHKFCRMYDDHIPEEILDGADCPYFEVKDDGD